MANLGSDPPAHTFVSSFLSVFSYCSDTPAGRSVAGCRCVRFLVASGAGFCNKFICALGRDSRRIDGLRPPRNENSSRACRRRAIPDPERVLLLAEAALCILNTGGNLFPVDPAICMGR